MSLSLLLGLLAVTALAGVINTPSGLTVPAGVKTGEMRRVGETETDPRGTVRVEDQVGGSGTVGRGGRLA